MWSAFGVLAIVVALQAVYGLEDIPGNVPSRRATIPIRLNSRSNPGRRSMSNGLAIQSLSITQDRQWVPLFNKIKWLRKIEPHLRHRSYYAVIQTGNINFRVALDTGSSDLWVMSSSCTTKTCASSPRYPLAYHSSSFVSVNDNGTSFSTHFADGTGRCWEQFGLFTLCSYFDCRCHWFRCSRKCHVFKYNARESSIRYISLSNIHLSRLTHTLQVWLQTLMLQWTTMSAESSALAFHVFPAFRIHW